MKEMVAQQKDENFQLIKINDNHKLRAKLQVRHDKNGNCGLELISL